MDCSAAHPLAESDPPAGRAAKCQLKGVTLVVNDRNLFQTYLAEQWGQDDDNKDFDLFILVLSFCPHRSANSAPLSECDGRRTN
jgi:hypothetical protein